ncbi:TfuA domain-containing protein [Streptomyces mirabilis]|uniref:TfuA domain-containing protein n=1 Tax=Streptomyces mirabilis TaxID=68239 RepID=UPI00352EDE28
MVIIDGVYHQAPALRHKEILAAMGRGVQVFGAASIGALRATELAPFGMLGIGSIYASYVQGEIDGDDEVAVEQAPDGEWDALIWPVVNVRHALQLAVSAGVLDGERAAQLLVALRAVYYPQRTTAAVWAVCRRHGSHPAAAPGLTHARPASRLRGVLHPVPGSRPGLRARSSAREGCAPRGALRTGRTGRQVAPHRQPSQPRRPGMDAAERLYPHPAPRPAAAQRLPTPAVRRPGTGTACSTAAAPRPPKSWARTPARSVTWSARRRLSPAPPRADCALRADLSAGARQRGCGMVAAR